MAKMILNEKAIILKALQAFQENPALTLEYTGRAMGQSFALVAKVGGTRAYKSLNAVLTFMTRHLNPSRFSVEGNGWKPKQRGIAA